ncbi:MAG: hypothetical protein AABY22_24050 [Nanoarchaeota archaeon]
MFTMVNLILLVRVICVCLILREAYLCFNLPPEEQAQIDESLSSYSWIVGFILYAAGFFIPWAFMTVPLWYMFFMAQWISLSIVVKAICLFVIKEWIMVVTLMPYNKAKEIVLTKVQQKDPQRKFEEPEARKLILASKIIACGVIVIPLLILFILL